MKLAIVTATTNPVRAQSCFASWMEHATGDTPSLYVVENGNAECGPHLGTVTAFRMGTDMALENDADIIANLHDDVEIYEKSWDEKVLRHFARYPACGLLGFGGAIGLGDDDLYQKPYDPMSLARKGFRSDLVDAEAHGMRSLLAEKVACLDGFSQIGRRAFWEGLGFNRFQSTPQTDTQYRPWTVLEGLGIRHHFYDGALGCLARRYGWETWYLPVRCKHYGGRTAVGDAGYQDWANTQHIEGDHGFWQDAHRISYRVFVDVLPLRVR